MRRASDCVSVRMIARFAGTPARENPARTLLRWGIVLLMLTPVARVAVVTVGLALERDWTFTLVSLFVLAVLAAGIWVAVHR